MLLRFALLLLAGLSILPEAYAQPPTKTRTDALGDPLPPDAIARLGTLRLNHDPGRAAQLRTAIFSPDGKKIASLSLSFGSVRLWDAATGKELTGPWTTSEAYASAIAISPNCAILAAAINDQPSGNKPIVLWDMATAKVVRTIAGNRKSVTDLVFADAGKTILTVGEETVRWWDVATGKEKHSWQVPVHELPPPQGFEKGAPSLQCLFSPEGEFLAVQVGWSLLTQQDKRTFSDQEALVFNIVGGKQYWRVKSRQINKIHFAFSADRTRIAFTTARAKVEVRDTTTGNLVMEPLALETDRIRDEIVEAIAVSPDKKTLAIEVKYAPFEMWDISNSGRVTKRVARQRGWSPTFSPNGKTVLMQLRNKLALYDVATLEEVFTWVGHREPVQYLSFSSDGTRLASGSGAHDYLRFQHVITWDTVTWKPQRIPSGAKAKIPSVTTISPDDRTFVAKNDNGRLQLFDIATGRGLATLAVPKNQSLDAKGFFSPDNHFYFLKDKDTKGKSLWRLYAVPSGKLVGHFYPTVFGTFTGNALSPDGRFVVESSWTEGRILVFETETGNLRHSLVEQRRNAAGNFISLQAELAFSPDSKLLASWIRPDNFIQLWDMETGKEFRRLPTGPYKRPLIHFAWSTDGRTIAIGRDQIQIDICELASGKVRREFKNQEGDITALAFSPDGRFLATGSDDTTVLIWDIANPDGLQRKPLERGDLEKHWQTLAGADAIQAFATIRDLTAAPNNTVPFLQEKLKPALAVSQKQIEELIDQFDDKQYKVRENAFAELLKIGDKIVPLIDRALAGQPTLETRQRLQSLRTRLTALVLEGQPLQICRAVEILERIGDAEAKRLLQTLAAGAPGALVTVQAQAALGRVTTLHHHP